MVRFRVPPPVPVVRNLADAFRWMDHVVFTLDRHFGGTGIESFARSISSSTMSTAFSGIGSPEQAATTLLLGLQSYAATASDMPRICETQYAIELSDESRYELMMLPHAPKHVYGDINDFIDIGLSYLFPGMRVMTY